jgi:Derlin-2/3
MGFSLVLHGSVPKDEIMGVLIGHVWYFFTDVYPPLHNGSRPLDPPSWWTRLFERRQNINITEGGDGEIAIAGAHDIVPPEIRA